jgi:phosphatidylserine/phosphatidylglycerophosphate/cardiolipin synthase-like enzyme
MTNKNLKKYCNDLMSLDIPVKKNNNVKNLMHCKFMVIDDKFVVHGSMNLGEKSLKNYEHLTISSEIKSINQFANRFEAMWSNNNRFSDCFNDDDESSSS